jgi:AmmeMemoRadiSam system protein B
LVECLRHFDGRATENDLRSHLARLTGSVTVSDLMDHLVTTLREAGFLQDHVYRSMRDERHREFAEAPVREPSHAGGGYPEDINALRETLDAYLKVDGASQVQGKLLGIAAPHVSPEGGAGCYRAAYRAIESSDCGRTFVILGTSHYGAPDRFGLTSKPFRTPYGLARTDPALVDRLARTAPDSVQLEDYCHSTEHSIEFQVIFLQHLFGGDVRILPILCGSFARSVGEGCLPEDNAEVKSFLDALRELARDEGDGLFWVLGVDMAHMGRRYGDSFPARANTGVMAEVARRDRNRIDRIASGDAHGFWDLVKENRDDMKWCGSAALYTFMRAVPDARCDLLDYGQWNIDEESVVTFGALAFQRQAESALD